MKIKKAWEKDINFILNLYNQLWKERNNNSFDMEQILISIINDLNSDIFIIYFNNIKIWTFVLNYRFDLMSIGKAIKLSSFIIDENYQWNWIWTNTLKWIEKYWKDNWFSVIELLSSKERNKAHDLYIKNWYNVIAYWFSKNIHK